MGYLKEKEVWRYL